MTAEERERLIEAVLARYREVLPQRLRDAPQTLDEIEQAVEDISQAMDDERERRVLERQERPAVPEDNRAAGPHGGRWGRYRATEARQLVTRHGERTLARRRYDGRRCRRASCRSISSGGWTAGRPAGRSAGG
jgi:hypothetical protein